MPLGFSGTDGSESPIFVWPTKTYAPGSDNMPTPVRKNWQGAVPILGRRPQRGRRVQRFSLPSATIWKEESSAAGLEPARGRVIHHAPDGSALGGPLRARASPAQPIFLRDLGKGAQPSPSLLGPHGQSDPDAASSTCGPPNGQRASMGIDDLSADRKPETSTVWLSGEGCNCPLETPAASQTSTGAVCSIVGTVPSASAS
jgi:hypothetical protein